MRGLIANDEIKPRQANLVLAGLFVVALGFRFWGLERFNTLVFDEVYYAVFANKYLTWTPFFDGHPPLSKYLIAIGMWVGDRLPMVPDVSNALTGSLHKTWSYRWLNALTGSFIPLVAAALVYQLTQRWRITLLTAGLLTLDGLLLVESRYALNNVYLILFGLLGQMLLLWGLRREGFYSRWGALVLSGVFFGASASVKWNGLWYLFGTIAIAVIAQATVGLRFLWRDGGDVPNDSDGWWQRLGRINPLGLLVCLTVVPGVFYFLEWIPHLWLNHKKGIWPDFLELQWQILTYHQGVKAGKDVHPYCSTWGSWLWMLRPVAYFYRIDVNPQEMIPLNRPNPPALPGSLVYDVHAMGNPLLWWSSTLAMGVALVYDLVGLVRSRLNLRSAMTIDQGLVRWVNVGYLANLLPWVGVTRCIFLYHYMGAGLYGTVALAWVCDRLMRGEGREFVQALLVVIGAGFLFWLPMYLGLPMDMGQYRWRLWLQSWI
jgi:dolichyl-phosphate-mannose-protein mannosyltransferase